MPLIQRKGAQSSQGFGEFAQSTAATYIEDVFSTYLYAGTGATQTITNGIDLSTKGGLVWLKSRTGAYNNYLTTSATGLSTGGGTQWMYSNTTDALIGAVGTGVTAFNANGFDIRATGVAVNATSNNYVSWTFRKQAKFFDIVTYTGTGANRTIAHNLGSTPGCIIVKRTDTTGNWQVYHSGLTSAAYSIQLNLTNAQASATTVWNSTAPTSSVFSVGTSSDVNASGGTYVAYLFASNAGGFGSDGTQNVITCGSYAGSSSAQTITLGYEPQWVMIKCINTGGTSWVMQDVMRGMALTNTNYLTANTTNAENPSAPIYPNATGFTLSAGGSGNWNNSGYNYIYIAIRRGPMKTPTVGTSVYSPVSATPSGATTITTGFPVDMMWAYNRSNATALAWAFDFDRLRGSTKTSTNYLATSSTGAELTSASNGIGFDNNTAIVDNYLNSQRGVTTPVIYWNFQRAPGFFDEVCYTGTGSATTQSHNLAVIPELMIVKARAGGLAGSQNWPVYSSTLGATKYMILDQSGASVTDTSGIRWNNTAPTASVFSVGTGNPTNQSGTTYVAYLFASCPGVSKVGSYTGTGATQTIDCGFTGGARFVLIKRTNSTGDWYVWDTARGMVSGTDPSLLLNSTAAEVNANSVYTTSVGFQIVSTAAGINASGGTYIFLAIA